MEKATIKAFAVLGQKIADLETEVEYLRYRNEELLKGHDGENNRIVDLERRLKKMQDYVDGLEGEIRNED